MNIIDLNKDVEKYVLNSSGITFVHFSDIHARPKLWDRIVEYINNYPQISFALHTGDYCGGGIQSLARLFCSATATFANAILAVPALRPLLR